MTFIVKATVNFTVGATVKFTVGATVKFTALHIRVKRTNKGFIHLVNF